MKPLIMAWGIYSTNNVLNLVTSQPIKNAKMNGRRFSQFFEGVPDTMADAVGE